MLDCPTMQTKWVLFWLFVLLSWGGILFYTMFASLSPCEVRGSCAIDGLVSVLIWTLMPAQAFLAAYLKQRDAD
jgi:hypothetical protein